MLSAIVAHAGGWDELLIAAGAVVFVLGARAVSERRRTGRHEEEAGDAPAEEARR